MRCIFLSVLIFLVYAASCQGIEVKSIVISTEDRKVEIFIPSTWKHVIKHGVDSEVGSFITSSGDTLQYDLGRYSNSLNDPPFFNSELEDYKTKIFWTKRGGYKCKVVSFTYSIGSEFGIYFPKLWTITYDEPNHQRDDIKLAIYGNNVSKVGKQEILQTLKSLKVSK